MVLLLFFGFHLKGFFGKSSYCDDSIANGFSYFQTKLFHNLMSDGDFRFNIYTSIDRGDLIKLGETEITRETDFYEDIPETFNHYFINEKKVKYKKQKIEDVHQKEYNFFESNLKKLIKNSSILKNIFEQADRYVYPVIKKSTNKTERYISMFFFLIQPTFFNEEHLRLFGHHNFVNCLQNISEKQDETGIIDILNKLKKEYRGIETIRDKIVINTLLQEHLKYLNKLKMFEEFFRLYNHDVMNYLNSEKIKSKELADSKEFTHLVKLFYQYIDLLKIRPREIPEGY